MSLWDGLEAADGSVSEQGLFSYDDGADVFDDGSSHDGPSEDDRARYDNPGQAPANPGNASRNVDEERMKERALENVPSPESSQVTEGTSVGTLGNAVRNVSPHSYRGGTFLAAEKHGYRFTGANDFLYSVDEEVPIWGDLETPIWQSGESLMLVGPPGVGKSTLAHNLILSVLHGGSALDHGVEKIEGNILYLAMDRPKQIARAFRRLITTQQMRDDVEERVIFHQGPLPFNLAKDPTIIARMCAKYEVGLVIIDSIKDIVSNPSDEVCAGAYNTARQKALADGIEWIELHHNRKANGDNKEPKGLDDVYGNRFITAGAGSILSLWGASGDEIINISHIRMPGNGMNPTKVALDKAAGTFELLDVVSIESVLRRSDSVTAAGAAAAIYGPNYTESNVRSIRNKLKRMATAGKVTIDGTDPRNTLYRSTR